MDSGGAVRRTRFCDQRRENAIAPAHNDVVNERLAGLVKIFNGHPAPPDRAELPP
jgi:hypothetical protein